MKYPSLEMVLRIHDRELRRFGGDSGILNLNLLESALSSPSQALESGPLYPSIADKAAGLGYFLTNNHAFVDGNKRTGLATMQMFLSRNGHKLLATVDVQVDIFERIAGKDPRLSKDEFVTWVRSKVIRKGPPRKGRRRLPRRR